MMFWSWSCVDQRRRNANIIMYSNATVGGRCIERKEGREWRHMYKNNNINNKNKSTKKKQKKKRMTNDQNAILFSACGFSWQSLTSICLKYYISQTNCTIHQCPFLRHACCCNNNSNYRVLHLTVDFGDKRITRMPDWEAEGFKTDQNFCIGRN